MDYNVWLDIYDSTYSELAKIRGERFLFSQRTYMILLGSLQKIFSMREEQVLMVKQRYMFCMIKTEAMIGQK